MQLTLQEHQWPQSFHQKTMNLVNTNIFLFRDSYIYINAIITDENEERCMIESKSLEDPKVQELIQVLIEWINDELAAQRIIVQDLAEDLYDGQVLQKLLEKLTGGKLDVPEVTQSEEGQRQKLHVVLSHFNKVLILFYF